MQILNSYLTHARFIMIDSLSNFDADWASHLMRPALQSVAAAARESDILLKLQAQ